MNQSDIQFEELRGSSEQIDVLFKLLNEREHTISHKRVVSYSEHKKFVETHPYRMWFLVKFKSEYVGSFYLTNENTLGINLSQAKTRLLLSSIIDFVKINYKPLAAIPSVRNGRFAINVPPSNELLADALDEIGSELAQLTYYFPS